MMETGGIKTNIATLWKQTIKKPLCGNSGDKNIVTWRVREYCFETLRYFVQFTREKLTRSYTVYMVADFTVPAVREVTMLVFHKLLKSVFTENFVFLMVSFVLLCKVGNKVSVKNTV